MYQEIKIILLLIILLGNATPCFGRAIRTDKQTITLLGGVGSRKGIGHIVKNVKLYSPHSYFLGIGYRSPGIYSGPVMINVEAMKHFGRQDSLELVLYPSLESNPVYWGNIGFSWSMGDGISVMLGPYPKFEEAATFQTRRLLNFFLLEQNIFLASEPDTKLTLRWHHRCNFFRHMGPHGAGSNFIGIGIKFSF